MARGVVVLSKPCCGVVWCGALRYSVRGRCDVMVQCSLEDMEKEEKGREEWERAGREGEG